MVGTLKKNKREIPPEFKSAKEPDTSIFGFDQTKTLVSYTPKKNKCVLLLSTMHYNAAVNEESKKPEMVHFYNSTKGGTDTFDQLCHNYSTARRTNRWPLRVFFGMLDQSGVNSYVIYTMRNKVDIRRKDYLFDLGFSLVEPQLKRRINQITVRRPIRIGIVEILGDDAPEKDLPTEEPAEKLEKRVRCYLCERNEDKKTNIKCAECHRPTCPAHRVLLCKDCAC